MPEINRQNVSESPSTAKAKAMPSVGSQGTDHSRTSPASTRGIAAAKRAKSAAAKAAGR